MEKPNTDMSPVPKRLRGTVQFFRSHTEMEEADRAASAARSVPERWHTMVRLNARANGEWRRDLLRHGRREVFFYQPLAGETAREFSQRVTQQQREWTFSIRSAPLS